MSVTAGARVCLGRHCRHTASTGVPMDYPNVQLFIDVIGTVAHADRSDLEEAVGAADKGFKV
jgi:hypothetical protein